MMTYDDMKVDIRKRVKASKVKETYPRGISKTNPM